MKKIKELVKKSQLFGDAVKAYEDGKELLLSDDEAKALYEELGCPKVSSEYGSEDLEDWEKFIYVVGECIKEVTGCKKYYYSSGLAV